MIATPARSAAAALACALASLLLAAPPALAARRAALLVGESAGDRGDAPLRYAESDAAAVREVLVSIGGVPEPDATLLRGATAGELRAALQALSARLTREGWGKQDRLILYVSSHAGQGELHLRGTHFPLAELRRFVDESPAGVALLLLDTCEAGSVLRSKGVTPVSGRVLQLETPSVTGRVVIASAGPDESAFESDELGGSLFTQHFLAGLRGAADSSHDGRVTLQEAYAYAHARTVDSASTTQGGARATRQTPRFDLELQGEGELVLSEPALGRARLLLDVEAAGDWVVTSLDGSAQTARFVKGSGPVVLALDPGTWRLRAPRGDVYAENVVQVTDGAQTSVSERDLTRWQAVPAGRKGAGAVLSVLAGASVESGAVSGVSPLAGAAVGVRYSPDHPVSAAGLVFTATLAQVVGHASADAFFERELSLLAGAGFEGRLGPLSLRAVAEAGVQVVRQQVGAVPSLVAAQPRVDLSLGLSWPVAAGFSVDAAVSGGGLRVVTDSGGRLQGLASARAGAGYSW
jgi:hypothetical protein